MNVPNVAEKIKKETKTGEIIENSPEWLHIQNPIESNYIYEDGKVSLITSGSTLTKNNKPTFLGRRQESASFSLEA